VNELNPNAGSGDELQAIIANWSNKGPQAPDVIDFGLSFGPQAVSEGLITPYKVSEWDTIPASAKDPNGYWHGDYYGVLAFEVNGAIVKNVPQDWADLLKPEYKGQVALSGDPPFDAVVPKTGRLAGVWYLGMAPGDPGCAVAWSPASGQLAQKGGFESWTSDGGRTWTSGADRPGYPGGLGLVRRLLASRAGGAPRLAGSGVH
jgi:hypothetical protein